MVKICTYNKNIKRRKVFLARFEKKKYVKFEFWNHRVAENEVNRL